MSLNTNGEEKQKEPSLEEMFEELENLMNKMGSEDMTLEETFAGYKRGVGIVEKCKARIDEVEHKIEIVDSERSCMPESGPEGCIEAEGAGPESEDAE